MQMRVLGIRHPGGGTCGLLAERCDADGHELVEWMPGAGDPMPDPLGAFDALVVFGGGMNVRDAERLPWMRAEVELLRDTLQAGVPVLGICLGAQLLARAAHADVRPADEFEIGWLPVELTEAAGADPVIGRLPRSFEAFQWHYYEHAVPAGGVELAHSRVCTQAFRLGESAWGVQFHPEVTLAQVEKWIDEEGDELPVPADALLRDTRARIDAWNTLGRQLCSAFVEVAERVAAPA